MPPSNEFLAFCPTDTGLNLLSQADYSIATDRSIGNQPGIASSKLVNKAIRQATYVAQQLAQYMVNQTGSAVLDDENSTNFQSTLSSALGVPTFPRGVTNLGLAASVSGNALTIAVKDSTGADPTGLSPVKVSFRNSTSANGTYSVQSITAALSITVPSSATLGQVSAVNQYVWVYLIYDGSTVQLGVSGVKVFDDLSTQSSTTISSGSTLGTTLYSSTGISNKAIRLIGRILVNEATAGTWATTPSELSLMPVPTYSASEATAYTPTLSGGGVGTPTNIAFRYYRRGNLLKVYGSFTAGTVAASVVPFPLPSGLNLDTSATGITINNLVSAGGPIFGRYTGDGVSSAAGPIVSATATSTTQVYIGGINSSTNPLIPTNGSAALATNGICTVEFEVPILGWSEFGP